MNNYKYIRIYAYKNNPYLRLDLRLGALPKTANAL